ncbi:MAG: hypothetical protein A2V98_18000 [Planctomycetes bacterium RBG_16_64_12]|nr:MAG: hypothetical protein A2V98_18000 [Planctomycetes bacterium RBG_16_64_12]
MSSCGENGLFHPLFGISVTSPQLVSSWHTVRSPALSGQEKGLVILEDCAHAHNASINGKYVGNWGQIGAFSCQGSKVLPAIEGGMANYECPGQFPGDSKYGK